MAKLNQAMTDLLRYNAAMLPQVRSRFDKSHSHTTTFDSGYLIPLMWDRVLPGDEKEIRISSLVRMTTPIHPVMDSAYFYTWCVYVPDRLWWNHAKEFYGENKDASFNPDGEYVMPYLKPSQYSCWYDTTYDVFNQHGVGSLNDYLGMPYISEYGAGSTYGDDYPQTYITAGLHRCYQLIWNELFRNSSLQPALQLNDGDTVTDAEWNVISQLRKVNKHPDRFTTLLLEPQAGEDVLLPISEWVPVVPTLNVIKPSSEAGSLASGWRLRFDGGDLADQSGLFAFGAYKPSANDNNAVFRAFGSDEDESTTDTSPVQPTNLWAHMSSTYVGNINALRSAITIQQLLEADNQAGKRYQAILYRHFSIFTPDATVQRPELLGASMSMLGMRQVLQTSESTDASPQANPAAVSVTNVNNEWICNKAFTEPGVLMVLGAIRVTNSFSQGVDPLLRKLNRFDHYWPVFDNLGNQPVYVSEIFADFSAEEQSIEGTFDKVFGYKEAWQEYKVKDNRVSGLMRPNVDGNLASWNYSSYFEQAPILNSYFIEEDPNLVDRTIAVPSEPQFLCDCYFEYFDTKSMSTHSVPGLTRL